LPQRNSGEGKWSFFFRAARFFKKQFRSHSFFLKYLKLEATNKKKNKKRECCKIVYYYEYYKVNKEDQGYILNITKKE
jgi:hypothetical protein